MRLRPIRLFVLVLCPTLVSVAAEPPIAGSSDSLLKARNLIAAKQPLAAVELLEQQLPQAGGNKIFLDELKSAYSAAILHLQSTAPDQAKESGLRTKLALLGGTPPAAPPARSSAADNSSLKKATDLFHQAKNQPVLFGDAAKMFAAAFLGKVTMTPDQMTAWAYCRIRVAADQLNHAGSNQATAAEVVREVEEALKLAPGNASLQKAGTDLLAEARRRAGDALHTSTPTTTSAGWAIHETPNFVVKHHGDSAVAQALAQEAERLRTAVFTRWSGPAGGAWNRKCEIVLHTDGASFAASTKLHSTATGHALVRLQSGQVVERRIELRADDATAQADALPRELTHIILADLFPNHAPPKWAIIGMAVLATTDTEVDRYRRTLPRCYQAGELMPLQSLFALAIPPSDRVTGYLVESVSVVDFLVKWKGEKAFTTFLRDEQRYGLAAALKRQYDVSSSEELESLWKKTALTIARGQGE